MKKHKIFKVWSSSAIITLVTLLILLVTHQTAYADTSNYTYYHNEKGIVITGYDGADSNLIIPGSIDGQVVVGIGNNAFSSSTTLTSIVIPDTVTYIGDNAFSNNTNLTNVKFMGDAPSIGDQVFSSSSPELIIFYSTLRNGFSNPWFGFTTISYVPDITPIPVIQPVTGITLDKTSLNLRICESISLIPSLIPVDATNKNITWTSSNPIVAIVDGAGFVQAINLGDAIITATTEDGGLTAICSINVSNTLAAPSGEFAVPLHYDSIKATWSIVPEATGYEIYRSDTINGEYKIITSVQAAEYTEKGLNTGTVYYYKVRAYKAINDTIVYSEYTPIITVKTLDKSINSTLFLYMSDLNNRNSVYARAVAIHYGDPRNTCAITVSEVFRRIGVNMPISTVRTNQVEDHLKARGWKREMNLNLMQPGDIGFTTDRYGNLLGGHSTHVFIFMGWANKEKTLMNISDNQVTRYGSVLHTRTILKSKITDATAFFYRTNLTDVSSILKLQSTVKASPIAYNKVKLTWDSAPGAYGYKIYRSTAKNGTYIDIATTSTKSYIDTKVVTGKTYYYKVRAYNKIQTSKIYGAYSNILAAKPVLTKPATYVKSNANRYVKLTWNGVSGANGYQVYRSTSKNGLYSRVTATSKTTYAKSGLTIGKDYYYKVRAYRYVGKTKVYSDFSFINLKAI